MVSEVSAYTLRLSALGCSGEELDLAGDRLLDIQGMQERLPVCSVLEAEHTLLITIPELCSPHEDRLDAVLAMARLGLDGSGLVNPIILNVNRTPLRVDALHIDMTLIHLGIREGQFPFETIDLTDRLLNEELS